MDEWSCREVVSCFVATTIDDQSWRRTDSRHSCRLHCEHAPRKCPNVQVPFPLSQVFTLTSLDMRADAFTFLLELRYASSRMNEAGLVALGRAELQVIRQRLMWVIQ